jgi:hypothetical protein
VRPAIPTRIQQQIPVEQRQQSARAHPESILNPLATPFSPAHPIPPTGLNFPRAAQLPAPSAGTRSRPHLVYTEIGHMRFPTMHPPEVVIPRLRELPAQYIHEDGGVELHLQWVIAQIGYAHFQAGESGRAELVPNSWFHSLGEVYGLSRNVIRWLAGRIPGGVLRVPPQEAVHFWGLRCMRPWLGRREFRYHNQDGWSGSLWE